MELITSAAINKNKNSSEKTINLYYFLFYIILYDNYIIISGKFQCLSENLKNQLVAVYYQVAGVLCTPALDEIQPEGLMISTTAS